MSDKNICSRCGVVKDVDQFHWKNKANGTRQRRCKECWRAYIREWYVANKPKVLAKTRRQNQRKYAALKAYVDEVKSAPCMDCGHSYPPWVMEHDHRDPTVKIGNISRLRRQWVSLEKLKDEIAKCDLVCANCHRQRTHNRMVNNAPTGNRTPT